MPTISPISDLDLDFWNDPDPCDTESDPSSVPLWDWEEDEDEADANTCTNVDFEPDTEELFSVVVIGSSSKKL